jgi:O-antigen/teichoic acid export membrane protein
MQKKENVRLATDSFILTLVQCMTLVTGMAQTMILSRTLTKIEYGTYSQGVLIVNSISPFLLLGLSNAVNFFFNQEKEECIIKRHIESIFGLVFYIDFFAGILIIISRSLICNYFSNELLEPIVFLVAFRPLLENIISLYQPLFISSNMSKTIAARNLFVGVSKVFVVGITITATTDITLIFRLLLLMDLIQVLSFRQIYQQRKYKFSYFRIDRTVIFQILKYAFPLSLSTIVGTFSINMDKLIVGRMLPTEEFALYSNMARELPFSFVVSSLTTIITPILIRLKSHERINELKRLWSQYIESGIIITWILTTGAILCSKELIIFLYSDKYIEGISIFIVYLIVSMTRITYFGMILTLFGKTGQILYYSCAMLVLNGILNFLLIKWLGIIGPAISTLISTVLLNSLQLKRGLSLLQMHFKEVLSIKSLAVLLGKLIVVALCTTIIKQQFVYLIESNIIRLIIIYVGFITVMCFMEYKKIKTLFNELNSFRI